ncbi:MAG: hypothetical protein JWM63_3900 [Gammaproteobacteria bacterium]|nr:hypothetical protein [Gammaproteobacteria bacterium]
MVGAFASPMPNVADSPEKPKRWTQGFEMHSTSRNMRLPARARTRNIR